jgi:DNA-binding response OmpR family regulator
VQTAGDGLQALQIVHAFKPDLIILDMNMPRMGGIEFYSKICGPDGRPMYPVLVLTARANVEGLFKDFEIGGFMIKPFEIDQLVHEAQVIIQKKNEEIAKPIKSKSSRLRKICIVENNPEIMDKLGGMFLTADCAVIPAQTGTMAIERIMNDVPDVAVVQLGLKDISGDTVIFRLSQMSKTMDVKFILYTSLEAEHHRQVMTRIGTKEGIVTFVEYTDLAEVLEAVRHA